MDNDIKLKSHFLGPKSESGDWLEQSVVHIFKGWCEWRRNRFPEDGTSISQSDVEKKEFQNFRKLIDENLMILTSRFEDEIPKYSPRYMGHMVSEISLPALYGHLTALIHNPNNSSLSAAKVGAEVENEGVKFLLEMIDFPQNGDGHFTSGGTVANIEGLWRARFRLDHGLSLGAYLKEKNNIDINIFTAAHLGGEKIEKELNKLKPHIDILKSYSFVLEGAYAIGHKYKKIFNEDFKGPVLLVPAHKHYSWQKALSLMGLGEEALWSISINSSGHLSVSDLKHKIEKAKKEARPILAVVTVAGTTELGMVDPIDEVQDLLDWYKEHENIYIWHHVDGAYGGFYTSLLKGEGELDYTLDPLVKKSLSRIKDVNSITLDPHKLAMVPYACGAILVRDKFSYQVSQFKAPYLKENDVNSGKWNSTLEGSRAATGASAVWLMARSLGFDRKGIGSLLSLGLGIKSHLEKRIKKVSVDIRVIPDLDTNILCFTLAKEGEKTSVTNERVKKLYREICEEEEFFISQTALTREAYGDFVNNWVSSWEGEFDTNSIMLIRMVLMNPFTMSQSNTKDYLGDFIKYFQSKI